MEFFKRNNGLFQYSRRRLDCKVSANSSNEIIKQSKNEYIDCIVIQLF